MFTNRSFEYEEYERLQNWLCDKRSHLLADVETLAEEDPSREEAEDYFLGANPRPGTPSTTEKPLYVILANRVFGFNGWSYSIVEQTLDYVDFGEAYEVGAYCTVRVILKDGTFREGCGYGISENITKGYAIRDSRNMALSEAIKDALKGFGSVFQKLSNKLPRPSCTPGLVVNSAQENVNDRFADSDSGECPPSLPNGNSLSLSPISNKRSHLPVAKSPKKSRNSTARSKKSVRASINRRVKRHTAPISKNCSTVLEANEPELHFDQVPVVEIEDITNLKAKQSQRDASLGKSDVPEAEKDKDNSEIQSVLVSCVLEDLPGEKDSGGATVNNLVPTVRKVKVNQPSLNMSKQYDYLSSLHMRRARDLKLF